MSKAKLIITPKTRIGELLEAYPQLEDVLMGLSPAFARLRNPILRKTVARVASLQQAAAIGNLEVDILVNRLRKEIGQEEHSGFDEHKSYLSANDPEWLSPGRISQRYDATPLINSGGSPMTEIVSKVNNLLPGEILELKTPFIPAPIIDLLKEKGFRIFSRKEEGIVLSYITKSE